jgi:uncharacterized protein
MSLLETLRERLTASRRAGNAVELSVLQVVLGEASMHEGRTGKKPADEEVEKLIRKTILGNQETLGLLQQRGLTAGDNLAKLTAENALLQSLLPKTLSPDEIAAQLADVADAVRAARSDGQATGVAVKHLKGKGLKVLGEDVAQAVKKLRG